MSELSRPVDVYVFRGPGRHLGFTATSDGRGLPPHAGPWSIFTRLSMSPQDDPRPLVHSARECLQEIEMHGCFILDGHKVVTDTFLG